MLGCNEKGREKKLDGLHFRTAIEVRALEMQVRRLNKCARSIEDRMNAAAIGRVGGW